MQRNDIYFHSFSLSLLHSRMFFYFYFFGSNWGDRSRSLKLYFFDNLNESSRKRKGFLRRRNDDKMENYFHFPSSCSLFSNSISSRTFRFEFPFFSHARPPSLFACCPLRPIKVEKTFFELFSLQGRTWPSRQFNGRIMTVMRMWCVFDVSCTMYTRANVCV